MDDRYNFREIEARWQQRWEADRTFRAPDVSDKPKFYGLEFFPYPSGAGLHVGHLKNYVPTDAFCRFKSMTGFNVLHPMGWDAFGQPAENEAIRLGRNPREMVPEFAASYKRTLQRIGASYDWDREIDSSLPDYYRWTQWIVRSEGAEVAFPLDSSPRIGGGAGVGTSIRVFTTRPDTLFGATFMVLAPEHPLVETLTTPDRKAEVEAYVRRAQQTTEIERVNTERAKTGVFTGAFAI